MSQDERAIIEVLNKTVRREELLGDARGSWRLSWSDLGSGLTASLFLFLYLTSREVLYLAAFGGAMLMWHDKRIERRIDAIVRLLEREA